MLSVTPCLQASGGWGMNYRWTSALQALGGAVLAVGVVALAWLAVPERSVERWREAATDRLLVQSLAPIRAGCRGRYRRGQALMRPVHGPGPARGWPTFCAALPMACPRVVGVDIVLAGEDRYAPRRLIEGLSPTDEALRNLLAALPDTDAGLAASVSAAPTVLAALFSDRQTAPDPAAPTATLASVPVLMTGTLPALAPWATAGAVTPLTRIAEKAAGIGIASLVGDADGLVRRAPLMGTAGAAIVPGLAAEVLRQSQAASAFIFDGKQKSVSIGDYTMPLTRELAMRLRPSLPQSWPARTVSATAIFAGDVPASRFEGKIVLVGGSAPSLGALRATAATPLAPSVQVQADALETLLSRHIPYRPGWALPLEIAAFIALAAVGALAGALLGAASAGGITLAVAGLWAGGALAALATRSLVIDPVTPALAAIVAVIAAGSVTAVMQAPAGVQHPTPLRAAPRPRRGGADRGSAGYRPLQGRAARNHRALYRYRGLHLAHRPAGSHGADCPARRLFRRRGRGGGEEWRHGRQDRRRCGPCPCSTRP